MTTPTVPEPSADDLAIDWPTVYARVWRHQGVSVDLAESALRVLCHYRARLAAAETENVELKRVIRLREDQEHHATMEAGKAWAARDAALAERDKLQAFKDWVHTYLDAHGVPHHPPGTHGAEGCRIGDRMDWLMARLPGPLTPPGDKPCA